MKKQIPNSFQLHPFKNPHRLPTEPMGIHHSPHTHTIPIPMGIPIPTAALIIGAYAIYSGLIRSFKTVNDS